MLIWPGIVFASVVSLVGLAPGRKLLPFGSHTPGPSRAEGSRNAGSVTHELAAPRRDNDQTARPSERVTERVTEHDLMADDPWNDAYWEKLLSYGKDASTHLFVADLRRREWLGPFSVTGIYTQYQMYCQRAQRRPVSPRKLQNELPDCGVILTRPRVMGEDGKEARPTMYVIKPAKKKKSAERREKAAA